MEVLILAFTVVTQTFNLPPGLLSALCHTESNHRTHVVNVGDGNGNSLGVCQVQILTAKTLGFKGTEKQLMDPTINVYYSGKYLRKQLNRYDGDIRKAVAAYNSGTYYESKKGFAVNQKYVNLVFRAWSARK